MLEHSDFIVKAMKYVDEKIDNLNPKSVDRKNLHDKVQIQIVANIKQISGLEHCDAYKEIDNIFNKQLLEAILKQL